jgi:putative two-component system response regulator
MRLVAASEFRDSDTGLHLHRMASYAVTIANALGWSPTDIDDLRLAAPMHDIGKIGISDHILRKPGKLTTEEFDIMRKHTEIGAEIIGQSDIPLLKMARDITLNHHERWDGQGYLHGLSGDAIPESARIVAFADDYDALTSNRVYRPAFSEEEAQAMMLSENGRQFDPQILQASPNLFASLRKVKLEMESLKMSCMK